MTLVWATPVGGPREVDMAADAVVELDPHRVLPPPENRPVALADVADLLASVRACGQRVPILACPHPADPAAHLGLDGNRRVLVCRALGVPVKAVLADRPLDRAEQAVLRVTCNAVRKMASPFEVGSDISLLMAERGLSQSEAARLMGLSDATASRYRNLRHLAPEARALIEAGKLDWSAGYRLSPLAPSRQAELAARAAEQGLSGDQVRALIEAQNGPRGRKERKPPAVTVTFTLAGDKPGAALVEQAQAFAARAAKLRDLPAEAIRACLAK